MENPQIKIKFLNPLDNLPRVTKAKRFKWFFQGVLNLSEHGTVCILYLTLFHKHQLTDITTWELWSYHTYFIDKMTATCNQAIRGEIWNAFP